MGKTDSFVHRIPFDLMNTSSQSIFLDLISFDYTCMVIDQYLQVPIILSFSRFSFLDLTISDSKYMVIDQYIHRPSLLSQFEFFRDAYIGSTCIVIEQWFMLYLSLPMMIRLAHSFALSFFRLRIRIRLAAGSTR